eukprot:676737-Pelagomonas_calceolata.AAC.2
MHAVASALLSMCYRVYRVVLRRIVIHAAVLWPAGQHGRGHAGTPARGGAAPKLASPGLNLGPGSHSAAQRAPG